MVLWFFTRYFGAPYTNLLTIFVKNFTWLKLLKNTTNEPVSEDVAIKLANRSKYHWHHSIGLDESSFQHFDQIGTISKKHFTASNIIMRENIFKYDYLTNIVPGKYFWDIIFGLEGAQNVPKMHYIFPRALPEVKYLTETESSTKKYESGYVIKYASVFTLQELHWFLFLSASLLTNWSTVFWYQSDRNHLWPISI